jgi:hypothetical protein
MATTRHKAIAELMNGLCTDRTFTGNEVALIENLIRVELADRKAEGLKIETKTSLGKQTINTRIAARINAFTKGGKPMTYHHIRLYKRCWADEYSERSGKCSWGFPEVRRKFGYDPTTGQEVV